MSQKNNNLYLYGKHAVLAALKNPRRKNQKLYITEEAFEEVLRETKLNLDVIKTNNQQLFAFVSKDAVHQGMVLKTETIFGNDIIRMPPGLSAFSIRFNTESGSSRCSKT